MTQDQFMGLIRQVLQAVGAILTTLGLTSAASWGAWSTTILLVAGPAFQIGSLVWNIISNSKSSIIKSASAMPETVSLTTTDPKLADAAKSADPSTEVKVSS